MKKVNPTPTCCDKPMKKKMMSGVKQAGCFGWWECISCGKKIRWGE